MTRLNLGDKCKQGHVLSMGTVTYTSGRMRCSICQRDAVDRYYERRGSALAKKRNARRWATDEALRLSNRESKRREYSRNPEKFIAKVSKNAPYRKEYGKRPEVRVHSNMSRAIRSSLRNGKNGRSWELLLGYTASDLMRHLEERFRCGMSWKNYGEWEIDHIIPKSKMCTSGQIDESFLACWSLVNLQPLWKRENRHKHARLDYYQFGGVLG